MSALGDFKAKHDLSMEALCARMLDRHRDTVNVKKPRIAVPNLARIVTTTLSIGNRKGFQSMSLRDLARETGLSMGALYSYFDSKETLLAMILGEVAAVVEDVLGAPPTDLSPHPRERLRWLLESHILMTEVMQPWFAFAFMEVKGFPAREREAALASELRTESLIAGILAEGREAGLFAVGDVAMTAAMVKPLLQDWYLKRWKYRRRGVSAEQYAAHVVAFVEAALFSRVPVSP